MSFPASTSLTDYARKRVPPPFTFKLPHVQAEREQISIPDEQYLRWVLHLKSILRGRVNLVMVRHLQTPETSVPHQVVCAAEHEIHVGQSVCLLREYLVNEIRILKPQYARIGSIRLWTGPFIQVSLEVFDSNEDTRLEDYFILRSCFTVPPDLIPIKPDIDYFDIEYPTLERYF